MRQQCNTGLHDINYVNLLVTSTYSKTCSIKCNLIQPFTYYTMSSSQTAILKSRISAQLQLT